MTLAMTAWFFSGCSVFTGASLFIVIGSASQSCCRLAAACSIVLQALPGLAEMWCISSQVILHRHDWSQRAVSHSSGGPECPHSRRVFPRTARMVGVDFTPFYFFAKIVLIPPFALFRSLS